MVMALTLTQFRFKIDNDGIALLTWDAPGRSMNVFVEETMRELDQVVDHVAAHLDIKGCVITSGKPDSFSGGADIRMLDAMAERARMTEIKLGADEATRIFFKESRSLSLLFRKLETCGKPFAIAINGVCLGGATELALACHYRILSDNKKTVIGLPEIKIGIFPGAGGTQRVARLAPASDALLMMMKGEALKPEAAKKINLIHDIAPQNEIVTRAKAWIKQGGGAVAPWDQEKFKLPSGAIYSKAGMTVWSAANAIVRKETFDNYPAAKALVQSVYEGLQVPMDTALKIESRYFAHILRSREAKAMIRSLFVSMQALNKGARRPASEPATSIKRVGIIGAGFMGAGIATVSALSGIDVILIDRDEAAAEKGKASADKVMAARVAKGRATEAEREAFLARITPTTDYTKLSDCDLVIEAVFEDPRVKDETIRKAEAAMGKEIIFASNTSTLPITGLSKSFSRPNDFIGIHFFSPVDRMMLVEIIKSKETGPRAIATAFDFVRAIGKTPILVNDARGFYANRCVLNYLLEGHLMLDEGIPPALIENAARMAGMPVGPLSLSDEIALDLIYKIIKATQAALGSEAIHPVQARLIATLVEKEQRLGRKNGKGFYDYPQGTPKQLWTGLGSFASAHPNVDKIDLGELKNRFLFTQALEAVRSMEEGIVEDPREADIGAILGFGFAPFTGGPLSLIDGIGAAQFVSQCDILRDKFGDRFSAPKSLRDKARNAGTFY